MFDKKEVSYELVLLLVSLTFTVFRKELCNANDRLRLSFTKRKEIIDDRRRK